MNSSCTGMEGWKLGKQKQLSPREAQCTLYLATGKTDKEIAKEINTSPKNVSKRLECARFKLDVANRTALVVEAIRRGILTPLLLLLAILSPFIAAPSKANDDDSGDYARTLRTRPRSGNRGSRTNRNTRLNRSRRQRQMDATLQNKLSWLEDTGQLLCEGIALETSTDHERWAEKNYPTATA